MLLFVSAQNGARFDVSLHRFLVLVHGMQSVRLGSTDVRVNLWDLAGGEEYFEVSRLDQKRSLFSHRSRVVLSDLLVPSWKLMKSTVWNQKHSLLVLWATNSLLE